MAIAHVGVGSIAESASTTTLSPGLPPGLIDGDLLICYPGNTGNSATISMDAAWTQRYQAQGGSVTFCRGAGFTCVYTAPGPVLTVTFSVGTSGGAFIAAYRGGSVDGGASDPSSTAVATIDYPTLTPNATGDLCVFSWHARTSGTNGDISGTDPTVPTERLDYASGVTTYGSGYADGVRTASSATGARTSTYSAATANVGGLILLLDVGYYVIPRSNPIAMTPTQRLG